MLFDEPIKKPLKLTEEEIEAGRTEKGGFKRATLAAWGVSWPPPKGWREALLNGDPVPLPGNMPTHSTIVGESAPCSIEAQLLKEVALAVIDAGRGDILSSSKTTTPTRVLCCQRLRRSSADAQKPLLLRAASPGRIRFTASVWLVGWRSPLVVPHVGDVEVDTPAAQHHQPHKRREGHQKADCCGCGHRRVGSGIAGSEQDQGADNASRAKNDLGELPAAA